MHAVRHQGVIEEDVLDQWLVERMVDRSHGGCCPSLTYPWKARVASAPARDSCFILEVVYGPLRPFCSSSSEACAWVACGTQYGGFNWAFVAVSEAPPPHTCIFRVLHSSEGTGAWELSLDPLFLAWDQRLACLAPLLLEKSVERVRSLGLTTP